MELAVGNLIKIILGILVVAAVAYGLYYFFSNNVMDTFKNVGNSSVKFLLALY
jgi:hypothetical protein